MILAGDIANGTKALDFIKYHISNGVKHILYFFGNNEFYDIKNYKNRNKNYFNYDLHENKS